MTIDPESVSVTRQVRTVTVKSTSKDVVNVGSAGIDSTISVTNDPKNVVNVVNNGAPGLPGPPNNLSIGTVTVGEASASITGVSPNQVLNLVYPAATRHVHTQGTASTTWSITHALGGYPSVSIVDSAKTVVVGEVTYVSTTQVVVNFTSAFSGYAYLT
jgi:hypothetical protein